MRRIEVTKVNQRRLFKNFGTMLGPLKRDTQGTQGNQFGKNLFFEK